MKHNRIFWTVILSLAVVFLLDLLGVVEAGNLLGSLNAVGISRNFLSLAIIALIAYTAWRTIGHIMR